VPGLTLGVEADGAMLLAAGDGLVCGVQTTRSSKT
jgi:hypothetical protein